MRAIFQAAAVVACAVAAPAAAQDSADARLAALTDAYHDYRLAEYHQLDQGNGSTAPGDRLWAVTPEAHLARAARAREFLSRLDDPGGTSWLW